MGLKVYLIDPREINPSVNATACGSYEKIRELSVFSNHGHVLVDSPDAADIIIAASFHAAFGIFYMDLKRSALYKAYSSKIFVYSYDGGDFPSLPGVYAGAEKRFVDIGWMVAGHYLSTHLAKFRFTPLPAEERSIFFSFVGSSATHPVRHSVLQLSHPEAYISDSQAPGQIPWWAKSPEERVQHQEHFREQTRRSQFALCPRGLTPASIRLFEVMEAGCAPVVISDDIVMPEGPNWDDFVIFVREAEIPQIPQILEARRGEAGELGRRARLAWEQYFRDEVSFDMLIHWVSTMEIFKSPKKRKIAERKVLFWELFEIQNVRSRLRILKYALINKKK